MPLPGENIAPSSVRVRLNPEGIRGLGHTGTTLALSTPDGGRHLLEVREVESLGPQRFLVQGSVAGSPGSRMSFAVDESMASGAVVLGGGTRYSLGGNVHGDLTLSREESSARIRCATHGLPGAEATGIVLSSGSDHFIAEAGATPIEVDVLVVYTAPALEGAGGMAGIRSLTDHAFLEANTVLSNSQVALRLNLAGLVPVPYRESGNIGTDVGALAGITSTLRTAHRADLVMMIVEREDQGWDGVAQIGRAGGNSSLAYSVFRRAAVTSYPLVVHELGHLFGCSHDRQTNASDGGSGAFADSHGHRFEVDGTTYVTVMGYQPGISIPHFSNPEVSYRGVPTGIPLGRPQSADNARTLRLVAPFVAQYQRLTNRVEFAGTAPSVLERAGRVALTLQRAGPLHTTASLTVIAAPGTAVAGVDFDGWTNVVEFQPGEAEKTVEVAIHDDVLSQGSRTVELSLARPAAGTGLGVNSRLTLTIEDDDVPFEFAPPVLTVAEGAGPATLVIRRSWLWLPPVTARLDLEEGGNAGEQFTIRSDQGVEMLLPVSIDFPAGQSELRFQVAAVQDTVAEADSHVTLRLSGADDSPPIPWARLALQIRDDDREAVLSMQFAPEQYGDRSVGPVLSLPGGDILMMVYAPGFNPSEPTLLVRMHRDGRMDPGFQPARLQIAPDAEANFLYGFLNGLSVQPDGKILVYGQFAAINGVAIAGLARLLPDGTVDPEFRTGSGPNGSVAGTLLQPDGRILVCGSFTRFNGSAHSKLVRLNADGSVDESFRADFAPVGLHVFDIAFQGDRLLACGMFSSVNGVSRNNLCRLLPDGTVDATFRAGTGGSTWEIYPLADGRFYVRGLFRQPTQMIARYLANGTLDPTFRPPALTGYVFDLMPLSGDRLLVAGTLKQTSPATRNGVARLLSNGAVDPDFDLGLPPSGFVGRFLPGSANEVLLFGSMQGAVDAPVQTVATIRNFPWQPELGSPVPGLPGLEFGTLGARGLTHVLERTEDFRQWSPVDTRFFTEPSGILRDASPRDLGFYRVRAMDSP
ncbi:MAG: hypothetical protein J0L84_03670 [Verrucomicrobia bacterium]|nr:hypothetical protein [Verrucomicrobiota bacterium]